MKPFYFIVCLIFSNIVFSQNKLAMIVAVGQYPSGSGLQPIASANDVKYIRAILNKNGFSNKNIETLINAQATKAAILNSLTKLALKAKKNDIIVIDFGCHGQQIRDQKTVELGKDEEDGYDESLLPYDAKAKYNPTGYRGENHLRDDDLYPKLMAIRQKIGPQGSILVLLDACYSGTGTRSEGFTASRGEWIPFPDPENPLDSVVNLSGAEEKQGFFESNTDSLSNMVVISGSSPHQENKQVLVNKEELGSLSYSFYKAMSEMPPGNNYEFLFEKIKATIQALIPDQVPIIEGKANQEIFSGRYTAKDERIFIRVGIKAIPSAEDSVFTFDKGMMDNIVAGSECKIYKAGSKEPIANAVIRKVENFRSIGVANKLLKRTELYELKQDEENYGNLRAAVKLKFEGPATSPVRLENQVKQLFEPYRFLSLSDNADFQLAIKEEAGNKKASLTDRNNKLLWSGDIAGSDTLSIEDKKLVIANIKKALRVKYLRTMPDGGDLAPYISAEVISGKANNSSEEIIFNEGDTISLKMHNNSDTKLYYTVLDIYPDNSVKVLYPGKGNDPSSSSYIIQKGFPVIRRPTVSKGTPTGVEFFKIIVSKEPMDLRSVFEQTVQRDEMSSFQMVLDDLFNETSADRATRADVSSLKVEEIGIVTVHFKVKQK